MNNGHDFTLIVATTKDDKTIVYVLDKSWLYLSWFNNYSDTRDMLMRLCIVLNLSKIIAIACLKNGDARKMYDMSFRVRS